MDPETSAATWAERAQCAEGSVNAGFGHRLLRVIPGTWMGSIARPSAGIRPWDPWHYWWQAHYMDCLVDASWRRLGDPASQQGDPASQEGDPALQGRDPASQQGDPASQEGDPAAQGARGPRELRLAGDLLAGIRIRNALQSGSLRYRNAFYDDMAWLALAAGRADHLTELLRRRGLGSARTAARVLGRQLVSANTSDGGGGLFWNTTRRFKNTPATAPAALFFARTGERRRAQELVDWLHATLFDRDQGLYLDGINLNRDSTTELIRDVWTYNQGPVLGALLALGGPANLARAEALIDAVARHLTVDAVTGFGLAHDGARGRPLRGDGGGDGGLFMGILARYLTVAALSPDMGPEVRALARRLVLDTAESLWRGAEVRTGRRGEAYWTFPQKPGQTASDEYPPGQRVELSTQLQAWMVLEFAHQLTR